MLFKVKTFFLLHFFHLLFLVSMVCNFLVSRFWIITGSFFVYCILYVWCFIGLPSITPLLLHWSSSQCMKSTSITLPSSDVIATSVLWMITLNDTVVTAYFLSHNPPIFLYGVTTSFFFLSMQFLSPSCLTPTFSLFRKRRQNTVGQGCLDLVMSLLATSFIGWLLWEEDKEWCPMS